MNPFNRKKKVKLPAPPPAPAPRSLDEIKAEYGQLVNRAGQIQYQSYVAELELDSINKRLVQVNTEAKERQDLDKAEEAAKTETSAQ